MVLITGVIKNTDGSPYVGSVKFALNNLGIELNTVYLPTVVTVDSDGTFTVDLWPNTNSLTSTYYKCSLDNGSVFNVSIPGNNPSYNLGDVILIDPGTLDSGILRRLNQIESGITTRIGDLEYYTGIADNRIPSIALSGDYPNAVAGKVSKILTMGDGLTGGTYRGDTDVTVSVDGTVIRATDTRLSDAREWVAQTAPIEVVSQPTNTTRYAWTPQRIWDTIVSWFSTITSDDIPEGGGNLYYTDSRVSNNLDVQTNTTKVSATGSVTTHNDITSPGSGRIITTSERTKLGNIEDNAQVNTVNSVAGKTGDVVLDSNDVGLGNVPNIDTSNASNITSGTLSGSRLSYGTEANTPAQGNDARFTDSREWTASTVSQPVAQAGTDTTRHAWTSQRVRDNVASYTLPYTSAEKSKLAGLQNALDDKQDKPAEGAFVDGDKTKLDAASGHASATGNPHSTTIADIPSLQTDLDGIRNNLPFHPLNDNQYYYDNFIQRQNLRMYAEIARSDNFQFSEIYQVESWDGTNWVNWAAGMDLVKLMLDGDESTQADIPLDKRHFRFKIRRNTGWPTNTIFWFQTNWSPFGSSSFGTNRMPQTKVTISTSNAVNGTYTVLSNLEFGAATSGENWGIHANYVTSLHNGQVFVIIEVEMEDWGDSSLSAPIKTIRCYSNFNGNPKTPYRNTYEGSMLPIFNGSQNLGSETQRWGNLFLGGKFNASNLPTSATGLSAGDVWNDSGTLKIV